MFTDEKKCQMSLPENPNVFNKNKILRPQIKTGVMTLRIFSNTESSFPIEKYL